MSQSQNTSALRWFCCSLLSNRYMTRADRGHIVQGQMRKGLLKLIQSWNVSICLGESVLLNHFCENNLQKLYMYLISQTQEQRPLETVIWRSWSANGGRSELKAKGVYATELRTHNSDAVKRTKALKQ